MGRNILLMCRYNSSKVPYLFIRACVSIALSYGFFPRQEVLIRYQNISARIVVIPVFMNSGTILPTAQL